MSEPVILLKIEAPKCTRTHGTAPCTATETGDAKCFNTRRTCNDPDNFDKGTQELWFSRGMPAERGIVANTLPFIRSVSTTPGTMNFAGIASTEGGLGYVSTLNVSFDNPPYSGLLTDPYRDDRTYDPRANGAFWSNWLKRNPFHVGLKCTLYEGYAGEAIGAMQQRIFYSTKVEANRDVATLTAKDPTSYLDPKKSPVPAASPGVLHLDIDAEQVDIPVTRATTDDYPASGKIRIGDELIVYSEILTAPWGITFRASERGAGQTEAETHGEEDAVQEVFTVSGANIDTAIGAILDASEMPSGIYDAAQAAAEVDYWRGPWRGLINRDVSEPTPAMDLIGEICRQSLVSLDYDEYEGKLKLFAVHGYDSTTTVLTDAANLIADSVSIAMYPDNRFSRIFLHYDLKTGTSDPEDKESYRSHLLVGGSGESEDEHGIATLREIYVKWFTHEVLLAATGSRLAALLEDVPRKIMFKLAPKDRGVKRGQVVRITTQEDPNNNGAPSTSTWVLTKAFEPAPGEPIDCEGWEISKLGRVGKILANATADYVGDGSDDPDGAFILQNDGTLPDGSEGWRIQ